MTTILQAKPQDLGEVKAFYSHCGYGGGLKKEDLILIARSKSQLVGVVRLCPEQSALVLRGMQVITPFQRQGIGKQLLETCTQHLGNRICYCIPWTHLRLFYQRGGFEEVASAEVPNFLRKRFEEDLGRGMKVSIMHRLPIT